jgi:hypothetical protein
MLPMQPLMIVCFSSPFGALTDPRHPTLAAQHRCPTPAGYMPYFTSPPAVFGGPAASVAATPGCKRKRLPPVPSTSSAPTSGGDQPTKRRRGRPRKAPQADPSAPEKHTKPVGCRGQRPCTVGDVDVRAAIWEYEERVMAILPSTPGGDAAMRRAAFEEGLRADLAVTRKDGRAAFAGPLSCRDDEIAGRLVGHPLVVVGLVLMRMRATRERALVPVGRFNEYARITEEFVSRWCVESGVRREEAEALVDDMMLPHTLRRADAASLPPTPFVSSPPSSPLPTTFSSPVGAAEGL